MYLQSQGSQKGEHMKKDIDIGYVASLIPSGHENAKKLIEMVAIFDNQGLLGEKDKERDTRRIIARVGIDYVVCNLSDGCGYFRPTKDDKDSFRKWLAQEESRARELGLRINKGKKLFEDFMKERCDEQRLD